MSLYDRYALFCAISRKIGKEIYDTPGLRKWMSANNLNPPKQLGTIEGLEQFLSAINDGKLDTVYGVYTPSPIVDETPFSKRRDKMLEMRERGESLSQIAATFGVSRQRVHQVLSAKSSREGYHRS